MLYMCAVRRAPCMARHFGLANYSKSNPTLDQELYALRNHGDAAGFVGELRRLALAYEHQHGNDECDAFGTFIPVTDVKKIVQKLCTFLM